MSTTIMQSLTFVIFTESENRNVKVFATYGQSAGLTLNITRESKMETESQLAVNLHICMTYVCGIL